MMKVFSPGADGGYATMDGSCVFLELLWRYLTSRGIDVKGAPINSLWGSGVYNPFLQFNDSLSIGDADIIHVHDDAGFMLERRSVPLILSNQLYPFDPVYQNYTNYKQKAYHYLFYKRYLEKSYSVADALVVPSKFTADAIGNDFPALQVEVIHNGIDTEIFKPVDVEDPFPGKIKLLFVGNWVRRKGVDLFPKIMKRLGNDYILMHAGLRKNAGIVSENKAIKNCGSLPHSGQELAKLYNSSDIFVFPSRLEGLPFAVIEAMACGKPVVAANYSSLPELVVDGEGGYLCEMDNVEDFVERIRQLAFDAELRRKMGKFNRKRVLEKFTYQQMGERYLEFYREFL